jgi:bifunctional non-homologous end joining protein LigD
MLTAKSRRQYQSGTMPRAYIEPQLCKLVDDPPRGPGWVHETKFDGYRMQLHVRTGEPRLYTRKGLDWTEKFGAIAKAGAALDDAIIDGEICGIGKDGLPSFAELQAALSAKSTGGLVYYVFDMLWGNGEDLRSYPLVTRKKVLQNALKKMKRGDKKRIMFSEHHTGDGAALLEAACELKLEGIVSKRADAPYRSNDRGLWTKAKCRPGQEAVVGGWKTNGSKFKSLLLGAYRNGRFEYIGHAGTGFNARNLPQLLDLLKARASDKRPFENRGDPKPGRETHWAKPTLVVEVEFETWTRDGLMRQVAFKGVREDKKASAVVVETVSD